MAFVGLSSPPPPPDPLYTFRPYAGEVSAVQYVTLPDNRKAAIASGTTTGQLGIWDLGSKRQIWTDERKDQIMCIKFLQESNRMLSQCRGGSVDIWDLERNVKDCSFGIGDPGFCRLTLVSTRDDGMSGSLSPGAFIVANSKNGKVDLYDTHIPNHVSTFLAQAPQSTGMCMSVSSYCRPETGLAYLIGGFEDGSVLVWDIRRTDAELSRIKLFSEPVMCMDVSPHQPSGIAGSPSKMLEAFSLSIKEGTLEKKYSIELKNAGVADVAIRNDCKIFASGGWDGRIRVFGFKKGKALAILNYHSATVNSITFAGASARPEESNLLLCGSKDKRISLWRLY